MPAPHPPHTSTTIRTARNPGCPAVLLAKLGNSCQTHVWPPVAPPQKNLSPLCPLFPHLEQKVADQVGGYDAVVVGVGDEEPTARQVGRQLAWGDGRGAGGGWVGVGGALRDGNTIPPPPPSGHLSPSPQQTKRTHRPPDHTHTRTCHPRSTPPTREAQRGGRQARVAVALQRQGQGGVVQLALLAIVLQGGRQDVVQVLPITLACQRGISKRHVSIPESPV